MKDDIDYSANPLHGVSLNNLLIELVNYYGFDILFAYLNINCFKTNPSIESSLKFLKKTTWAREKVEGFYMYQYKNLPRASEEQFLLPPRDRVVPEGQVPGEPAELSLEDAERLRVKRANKSANYGSAKNYGSRKNEDVQRRGRNSNDRHNNDSRRDKRNNTDSSAEGDYDPWANCRK